MSAKDKLLNVSCYILLVKSESGDDYGPWLFTHKPTDKELKQFLKRECGWEFENNRGPGEWGSYLHIDWREYWAC